MCRMVRPDPAYWDTHDSVQKMTEVAVLLTWVDQTCCGPVRSVGDTFSSSIHNYQGLIYEERHADGVSIATYPMTGRITGIAWRPDNGGTYGPATVIASTNDLPDKSDWILEFTVETSDAIPEPRTDFL
jgi:hypothetical protein